MSPVAANPVVQLKEGEVLALNVEDLTFGYSNIAAPDSAPVLTNVFLNLEKGSRCILVGANGAGASAFHFMRDRLVRSARISYRCVRELCAITMSYFSHRETTKQEIIISSPRIPKTDSRTLRPQENPLCCKSSPESD